MSGLHLRAADLAKIGRLLADDGVWQGRRLLSHAWLAESTGKPGQALARDCALLWWLVPSQRRYVLDDAVFASWMKDGMDDAFVARPAAAQGPPASAHAVLRRGRAPARRSDARVVARAHRREQPRRRKIAHGSDGGLRRRRRARPAAGGCCRNSTWSRCGWSTSADGADEKTIDCDGGFRGAGAGVRG